MCRVYGWIRSRVLSIQTQLGSQIFRTLGTFFSISSRLIRSVVAQQKLILGQIFWPRHFFAKFANFFQTIRNFYANIFTLTKLGDDVTKLFSDYSNITFFRLGPKQFLNQAECLIVTSRKESFKTLNQEANHKMENWCNSYHGQSVRVE